MKMFSRSRSTKRNISTMFAVLFALMAVGGAASSGAQANQWALGGPGTAHVLSSGSKTISGSGAMTLSGTTAGGLKVSMTCRSLSSSGSVTAGGSGTDLLTTSGCEVKEPSHCATAPFSLEATTELIQSGGSTYEKFLPKRKTTFGEFEFVGAGCAVAELVVPVTGTFAGSPPTELAAGRRLAIAPLAGLELKLGGGHASVEGELTEHLTGVPVGSTWSSQWEGTHGGWLIFEPTITPLSEENVHLSGGPFEFDTSVSTASISIACNGVSVTVAKLESGATESINGLRLTGCHVAKPANCEVIGGAFVLGAHVTGSVSVISGKDYEVFSLNSGTEFEFGGPLCSLDERVYAVGGSFGALAPTLSLAAQAQEFELSKANSEVTGSKMTFGGAPATLSGNLWQELSGVNVGAAWRAA